MSSKKADVKLTLYERGLLRYIGIPVRVGGKSLQELHEFFGSDWPIEASLKKLIFCELVKKCITEEYYDFTEKGGKTLFWFNHHFPSAIQLATLKRIKLGLGTHLSADEKEVANKLIQAGWVKIANDSRFILTETGYLVSRWIESEWIVKEDQIAIQVIQSSPFGFDVPLGVLADWAEETDHPEAATVRIMHWVKEKIGPWKSS